jgi:hypothetical protein
MHPWLAMGVLKFKQVEQDVLADAIKRGYLHVDMPMTNMTELSSAETLDVSTPTRREPCVCTDGDCS